MTHQEQEKQQECCPDRPDDIIRSSCDAGEQLVTVGQQYLSDGDAVRVVEG